MSAMTRAVVGMRWSVPGSRRPMLGNVFHDLSLVAEDGRAVAVFGADGSVRDALADALSWQVSRQFRAEGIEADAVGELRSAGALAGGGGPPPRVPRPGPRGGERR